MQLNEFETYCYRVAPGPGAVLLIGHLAAGITEKSCFFELP